MDAPRDTAERRIEAGREQERRGVGHDRHGPPRGHRARPPAPGPAAADGSPTRGATPVPRPTAGPVAGAPPPAPPDPTQAPDSRRSRRQQGSGGHGSHHGIDRFAWRRRIRADPHRYRIYRVCVALAGGTMMALSVLLGWLPGPGGIPLFLLGLAVLASEFHWARRALDRTRAFAHQVHLWSDRQPVWVRWVSGLATVAVLLTLAWLGLRLVGGSDALPQPMGAMLRGVPGLD